MGRRVGSRKRVRVEGGGSEEEDDARMCSTSTSI